jgi:hypothetical protein
MKHAMATSECGLNDAEIERVAALVAPPLDVTAARRLPGAYRMHRSKDVRRFTELACKAFPNFIGRIACFGADWLGRQFATDLERIQDGDPMVLRLEPGTGNVAEIPTKFSTFHDEELVRFASDVIAYPYFKDWRVSGGVAPDYGECIGYKLPLYSGAPDDVANLERVDLAEYWAVSAALLAEVRKVAAPSLASRPLAPHRIWATGP